MRGAARAIDNTANLPCGASEWLGMIAPEAAMLRGPYALCGCGIAISIGWHRQSLPETSDALLVQK